MKYVPILFSTPMVRAISEGIKTVTRRVVKPQPIDSIEADGNIYEGNHKGYVKVDGHPNWSDQFVHEFSEYHVGDILWVRETWQYVDTYPEPDCFGLYLYKSMGDTPDTWRPSIFMPKSACRIFLEVTNVKVERLQDISIYDACNEGVEYWNIDTEAFEGGELVADYKNYDWRDDETYEDYYFPTYADPISSFRSLWFKINGEESWRSNPWVFVISFKKVEKPANFL